MPLARRATMSSVGTSCYHQKIAGRLPSTAGGTLHPAVTRDWWGLFTCSRQDGQGVVFPLAGIGEHKPPTMSAHHGNYPRTFKGGHIGEIPMLKDRQITTPHTGSTSPAQSAPFTRRHGLSDSLAQRQRQRTQNAHRPGSNPG